MSTVAKHSAEKEQKKSAEERVVESTRQFWMRNQKVLVYAIAIIVLAVGGFFAYKNYFKAPAEMAANEAVWTAEMDFKLDSFSRALNGDGSKEHQGFLKVIKNHSGTQAANLAHFYAGACYMQLGDFKNAVKYLQDYSSSEPETSLRAAGLLGDAYSELGETDKALTQYKKAAGIYPDDQVNSSEYLYRAAQLYDKSGKTNEAIESFKELKTKFPASPHVISGEADKYLAKLGVTGVGE